MLRGLALKNRRFGVTYRLLVTVNFVPSSPILVSLMMMDAVRFSKSLVLQDPHGVNTPKDGILHCGLV
jgi:hypothetical protein